MMRTYIIIYTLHKHTYVQYDTQFFLLFFLTQIRLKNVKDDLKELAEDTTNLDRLVTVVKELQEINAEIKVIT